MPWVSLSVEVDALWAECLADALLERGALSVEVTDADFGTGRETPLFGEPGEAIRGVWARNKLNALFEEVVDPAQALASACDAVDAPAYTALRVERVFEQDWVRATQQQFGPIQISSRLWVLPTWCEPPGSAAVVLRLDPGLAFGTGAHPTTWQCLRWLDSYLQPGQSVLDYGCGSGILAIAAKKLGAGRAVATDIDADALEVASRNACQNEVRLDTLAPEALGDEKFDVVVANILANPLRLLAPVLSQRVHASGHVVLAGILDAQEAQTRAAYAEWFDLMRFCPNEGWVCLAGARRTRI